MRLNALASTTSAADRPIGFIRSDPEWRETLTACIYETAAVANADGADIDPVDRIAELDDAHAELGSSMQRDIAAGREPELDAIAGAVLRAGARHGIPCPTVERLAAMVADAGRDPDPAPRTVGSLTGRWDLWGLQQPSVPSVAGQSGGRSGGGAPSLGPVAGAAISS